MMHETIVSIDDLSGVGPAGTHKGGGAEGGEADPGFRGVGVW
jgi:hypothetical protein